MKIESDRDAVTREIRDARTRAGLTQEQAAARLDRRATSTISRWESGGLPKTWDALIEYAYLLNQEIVLRFGPHKEAPRPAWAEGLDKDVPAIRRGVDELLEELAALRVALEANGSLGRPSSDDPVDDPSPAPHRNKHDQ